MRNRLMDVRTNEPHRFAESVATDPANQFRFQVEPLPKIDHAAVALKQAQERYLRDFPNADLSDLLWTITLVDESGNPLPDREAGVLYTSTNPKPDHAAQVVAATKWQLRNQEA